MTTHPLHLKTFHFRKPQLNLSTNSLSFTTRNFPAVSHLSKFSARKMSTHSHHHHRPHGSISQQPPPQEFMTFAPPNRPRDNSVPNLIHTPTLSPNQTHLLQTQAASSLPNSHPLRPPPRTDQPTGNPHIRPFQLPKNYAIDDLPHFQSTLPNQGLISHSKKPPKASKSLIGSSPIASLRDSPKEKQIPCSQCANCGVSLAQTPHAYTANLPCKHPSVCRNERCIKAFYGTKEGYALPYKERDTKPLFCRAQGCKREIEAWCKVDCYFGSKGDERLVNVARRQTIVEEANEKKRREEYEEGRLKIEREVEEKRREEDKNNGKGRKEEKEGGCCSWVFCGDKSADCDHPCGGDCGIGWCGVCVICCHEYLCCCKGLREMRDF
ncbi:hypothetical protein QBC38DRAFT_493893 [Podospora fimiseda]|uniref:Uncharacterized protein n=1 Tax=Podospora fimiseda TaxID=252190 RepID=A0AAN6YLA4_9PEZI|nr:hypothetical protein QBC38DRAFT_493893 [Podospora fimiseda]